MPPVSYYQGRGRRAVPGPATAQRGRRHAGCGDTRAVGPLRRRNRWTKWDLQAVLREQTGAPGQPELAAWVHGTGRLPLRPLLEACGRARAGRAGQRQQQAWVCVRSRPFISRCAPCCVAVPPSRRFRTGRRMAGDRVRRGRCRTFRLAHPAAGRHRHLRQPRRAGDGAGGARQAPAAVAAAAAAGRHDLAPESRDAALAAPGCRTEAPPLTGR